MKIFKKIFNKISKGFTIAEVAVSMTVIAVVTVTSITCIEKCRQISTESVYYAEARELANNALEIFKYSNDDQDFYNNTTLLDEHLSKDQNVYKYSNNLYSLEITINYNDVGSDTFKAICYKSNGKQLYKCEYQKR